MRGAGLSRGVRAELREFPYAEVESLETGGVGVTLRLPEPFQRLAGPHQLSGPLRLPRARGAGTAVKNAEVREDSFQPVQAPPAQGPLEREVGRR